MIPSVLQFISFLLTIFKHSTFYFHSHPLTPRLLRFMETQSSNQSIEIWRKFLALTNKQTEIPSVVKSVRRIEKWNAGDQVIKETVVWQVLGTSPISSPLSSIYSLLARVQVRIGNRQRRNDAANTNAETRLYATDSGEIREKFD